MKKQKSCKICGKMSKRRFCESCFSCNNGYGLRNYNLKAIGYDSYDEYIRSSLWADIRKRKLTQNPNCDLCDKKACTVHHQSYSKSTLLGNNLQKLHSLCKRCHYIVEFEDGVKLKFSQTVAKYRRLKKIAKYKRYINSI